MPEVVGDSPQAASRKLRRRGLTPRIVSGAAERRGTVDYADPGVGEQIGSGRTVTLFLSDGTSVTPAP